MKPETQTPSEGELRWLAEQATPGPWYSIPHGVSTEQDIPGNRAKENICGVACTRGKYEPEERNRDYIAAANPQTMIALLDKLTTATERAERMERALDKYGRHAPFCVLIDPLEPSVKCTCGFKEALSYARRQP